MWQRVSSCDETREKEARVCRLTANGWPALIGRGDPGRVLKLLGPSSTVTCSASLALRAISCCNQPLHHIPWHTQDRQTFPPPGCYHAGGEAAVPSRMCKNTRSCFCHIGQVGGARGAGSNPSSICVGGAPFCELFASFSTSDHTGDFSQGQKEINEVTVEPSSGCQPLAEGLCFIRQCNAQTEVAGCHYVCSHRFEHVARLSAYCTKCVVVERG